MKLKTTILLTILFTISTTVFAQKQTVKTKTETKATPEIKTTTVKMPTAQEILA